MAGFVLPILITEAASQAESIKWISGGRRLVMSPTEECANNEEIQIGLSPINASDNGDSIKNKIIHPPGEGVQPRKLVPTHTLFW